MLPPLNDTSVVINDTTPVMERHDRCHRAQHHDLINALNNQFHYVINDSKKLYETRKK